MIAAAAHHVTPVTNDAAWGCIAAAAALGVYKLLKLLRLIP